MYNWRVETFNNLLYLDISTHLHAYIIDSNSKLSYSYRMFNKLTFKINDYGMRIIFKSLNNFINNFKDYNNYIRLPQEEHITDSLDQMFFRNEVDTNFSPAHCRTIG